jgi:hypothetical protein
VDPSSSFRASQRGECRIVGGVQWGDAGQPDEHDPDSDPHTDVADYAHVGCVCGDAD